MKKYILNIAIKWRESGKYDDVRYISFYYQNEEYLKEQIRKYIKDFSKEQPIIRGNVDYIKSMDDSFHSLKIL